MLLGTPNAWDGVRVTALLNELKVEHATARKKKGASVAFIIFSTPAQRAAAELTLAGHRVGTRKLALKDARQRAGACGRPVKAAGDIDVRDVVTPLWRTPYPRQLADKAARLKGALARVAADVVQAAGKGGAPAWARNPSPVHGILRSPATAAYRNKSEFTAGPTVDGKPGVGFCLGAFRDGIVEVAPPNGAAHVSPIAVALAGAMTDYLRTTSALPPWDKRANRGFWRLLVVREGRDATLIPRPGADPTAPQPPPPAFADLDWEAWLVRDPDGEAEAAEAEASRGGGAAPDPAAAASSFPPPDMVAAVVQIDPTAAPADVAAAELAALARALRSAAAAAGAPAPALAVQHHSGVSNAAGGDAPLLPFPREEEAVGGGGGADAAATPSSPLGCITDTLCGLRFRVSPTSFFQVNSGAAAALYRLAVAWANPSPGDAFLDVCCGTGAIGIAAAAVIKAKEGGDGAAAPVSVVGVDIEPAAICDARHNAATNGVPASTFVTGRAEDALAGLMAGAGLAAAGAKAVAVVDPPRAGLHARVRASLRACPAVRRIVYVSCNPDSMAVDATALCAPGGGARGAPFAVVRAVAVDLFPHTAHCEAVVLLER